MADFAQKIAWGVLGGTTTKVTRSAARRMLHDDAGDPRLPQTARTRSGLATALTLAACTGIVLAIADVLREQRKLTTRMS
jgi:hypothetical protein